MTPRINIVLFALTGFGNTVLNALLKDSRVKLQAVFTVKYDQPFPYYVERQLLDVCSEKGVVCHHDVKVSGDEGMTLLRKYSPDLIVVATFKQILKDNVLNLPRLGVVNFHPSLLPRYRGPSPTHSALLNDDKNTGVTAHFITEKIDEGNILLQRSISIDESDNDGSLRKKLANLSGELVPELIDLWDGDMLPAGESQKHNFASFASKPTIEDGYLELAENVGAIWNMVRAYNPWPGTSFLIGDRRIEIDRSEFFQDDRPDGIYDQIDHIDVVINSQGIRLYRRSL